jgi:hypothetical protein
VTGHPDRFSTIAQKPGQIIVVQLPTMKVVKKTSTMAGSMASHIPGSYIDKLRQLIQQWQVRTTMKARRVSPVQMRPARGLSKRASV